MTEETTTLSIRLAARTVQRLKLRAVRMHTSLNALVGRVLDEQAALDDQHETPDVVLADLVGCLDGVETDSSTTRAVFAEGMVRKRRQGSL